MWYQDGGGSECCYRQWSESLRVYTSSNRARTIDLEVAKQIARMVKRDRNPPPKFAGGTQHNTLNRLHNGLLRMGRFSWGV